MTPRYFLYIILSIAFIACCHVFLPEKGMAQSIILHAVQVFFPLWGAWNLLKEKMSLSHFLLGGALALIALTDLNYFVMMYALKLDPRIAYVDLVTTVPYHLSYVLAGLGMILKFDNKKTLLTDKKLWFILVIEFLLIIPFVVIPSLEKFQSGEFRSVGISLSALFTSLFLMQLSLYSFISSRNISQALLTVGLFSFSITDWAIQVETLNRSQAVLSFNAFLWTLSGIISSLPLIMEPKSLMKLNPYSSDSLISSMRFRLVLALALPLIFLGLTLNSSWYGVVTISFGLIFGCITITFAVQYLYDSVLQISEVLKKSKNADDVDGLLKKTPLEMREAIFDVMYDRIIQERKVAAQVAHDIRSPLMVLNYALSEEKGVHQEVIKEALKGINQVAEDLLKSERKGQSGMEDETSLENYIIPLVQKVVAEKQYLSKGKLEIDFIFDKEDSDAMAEFHPGDMKRIISNIINNSLEATGEKGLLTITLKKDLRKVHLVISDNGPGFPERILEAPIQRGMSFKENGNGLGLSHAEEKIREWKGELLLSNCSGARVELILPLVERSPSTAPSKIMILDDEKLIHRIWKYEAALRGIDCEVFSKVHQMENELSKFSRDDFFLIDCHLQDNARGDDFMKKLLDQGFKNVFAMTALDSEHVNVPSGLKEVLPKNPKYFFDKHFEAAFT